MSPDRNLGQSDMCKMLSREAAACKLSKVNIHNRCLVTEDTMFNSRHGAHGVGAAFKSLVLLPYLQSTFQDLLSAEETSRLPI